MDDSWFPWTMLHLIVLWWYQYHVFFQTICLIDLYQEIIEDEQKE